VSLRAVRACALAIGVALITGGCGSSGHGTGAPATPRATATSSATTSATSVTTVAPGTSTLAHPTHHVVHAKPRPPAPNPGTLPQTDALPSADTPGFHAKMAALWRGVQSGRSAPALRAFFPEAAYVQVKAVGDPASDWLYRLVGDYRLDLAAAHALLGPHPASARLLRVIVARGDAHWVPPHICYNRVGYYEVPNSRLVYRTGGEVRSFGIASLISWRGVWYVVHLGAVVRHAAVGIVDDPESGPGAPVASSVC
jgi:hypothetical protein